MEESTGHAAPGIRAVLAGTAEGSERHWLQAYFATADDDLLRRWPADRWIEAAHRHRVFAMEGPPAVGTLRVEALGEGQLWRCLSLCRDRPFLVDTLQMTLREHGARIHCTLHPVLSLQRHEGALPEVAAEGVSESLVQIWFQPPPQGEMRGLQAVLEAAMADLHQVVEDFDAMRQEAQVLAAALQRRGLARGDAESLEGAAFLEWLVAGHFTFIGSQQTRLVEGADGAPSFQLQSDTGRGLARAGARLADTGALLAPRAELDKYVESTRLVVVTKAPQRAPVHHPDPLDLISIKRYDHDGRLIGTLRLVGLFTTDVYLERPRHVPLLRQKTLQVLERVGVREDSHAGRQWLDVLAQLPRDELWQSSVEELAALARGVSGLRDRHQLRLFLRRDRYGRYFSALIYLPRDRYGRELRDRLVEALRTALNGQRVERHVDFQRGGQHARLHVLVHTAPGAPAPADLPGLEAALAALTQTWGERLSAALCAQGFEAASAARYAEAFDRGFTEVTTPEAAVDDVWALESLGAARPQRARLLSSEGGQRVDRLRLYSAQQPPALSELLPRLEHFGFHVIDQDPSEVQPAGGERAWVHTLRLRPVSLEGERLPVLQERFEEAFQAILQRRVEDDALNALVLHAGLDVHEVVVLRVLVRYLVQTQLPYARQVIEQTLLEAPEIAAGLVHLFQARFDPALSAEARTGVIAKVEAQLAGPLEAVPTLEADRILRAALAVVQAGLRTNYFLGRETVSLKIDPARVPDLPLPRPMFEIYVYSPSMEGVHLRGGRVARGGLRWSDRLQDFRTEVLGLVKAQQVKNAIIVPVGAKGGFVVKRGDRGDREAWLAAGKAAYVEFLRGLLDLTDNRDGDAVVPPAGVVCHDAPDPYLVVAADKGTATFSDLANATAAEYGFWLGDAFASGGSQGYDHKKMGITARGAWESVKRHFLELVDDAHPQGVDIQREPFTVVGIGDMSGDVFGNGMLLSRQIHLVAAFDHRHVFIDPAPDAEPAHAERERLFKLPRSSWGDYDRSLLSAGGGIWPRSAKQIVLSDEVRVLLGIDAPQLSPAELIQALLKAPVDLLWNGGIGTYVKASHESTAEVGDRANDPVRINGRELRARVVGEGGNLGLTQAGRIEYALAGGRINTDAIDNAGGVHSSDREVNIKIPLNALMQAGTLDRATRDPLLVSLTDDLVEAVLRDNQVQALALTLMADSAGARLDEYAHLIGQLERAGRLDRTVDGLPDEEQLAERRRLGKGLTRPELAVVLAQTKLALYDDLVASEVVDDPAFEAVLLDYFPSALVARHGEALKTHQLRREIIATVLANAVCNRMGAPFVHRVAVELGVPRARALHAWAAAHAMLEADRYWHWLDAQPPRHPASRQQVVCQRVAGLLKHLCRGLASQPALSVTAVAERHRHWMRHFDDESVLSALLPEIYRNDHEAAVTAHQAQGFDEAEARALARTRLLTVVPDLVALADSCGRSVPELAQLYFALGEAFEFPWLHAALTGLQVAGRWPALARANLRDDFYRLQAGLSAAALRQAGADSPIEAVLPSWERQHAETIAFTRRRLAVIAADQGDDFMRLVVAARELYRLC